MYLSPCTLHNSIRLMLPNDAVTKEKTSNKNTKKLLNPPYNLFHNGEKKAKQDEHLSGGVLV